MFRTVLSSIHRSVDGALAASLIGLDGIAIDTVNPAGIPLETIGAEIGSLVKSMNATNTELDAGTIEQFSLVTEKYITFLSAVTEEYFILLVLGREGNYGRARFELMKAREALRDELS